MLFCLPFSSHSCSILWSPVEKEREEEEGKREFKNGTRFDPLTIISRGENRHEKSHFKSLQSACVLLLEVFGSVLFMYLSGAFNLPSAYHL